MPVVHAARRAHFGDRFVALEACAMLITRPANVCYLTGLACPHAALLVTALDATVLATHPRCIPSARRHCPDIELIADQHGAVVLVELAASMRLRRIAVEDHHLTHAQHDQLAQAAGATQLVPLGPAVEHVRQGAGNLQGNGEIALLDHSCASVDSSPA